MKKMYNRFCVEFFSNLANPLRLAILQSLLEKEKTVSDLVKDVRQERTLVSHNLARLLGVKLISFKKKGKGILPEPANRGSLVLSAGEFCLRGMLLPENVQGDAEAGRAAAGYSAGAGNV